MERVYVYYPFSRIILTNTTERAGAKLKRKVGLLGGVQLSENRAKALDKSGGAEIIKISDII